MLGFNGTNSLLWPVFLLTVLSTSHGMRKKASLDANTDNKTEMRPGIREHIVQSTHSALESAAVVSKSQRAGHSEEQHVANNGELHLQPQIHITASSNSRLEAVSMAIKQAARRAQGLLGPDLTGPNMLTIVFIMVGGYHCFMQWLFSNAKFLERMQQAQKARDDLEESINGYLSDMEGKLNDIWESNALLAERNFEGKRRDFRHFLKSCPDYVTGDQALQHLRDYILSWAAAFQECSMDPVERPHTIVTAVELGRCESASAVADLMVKRLEKKKVELVAHELGQIENEGALMEQSVTKTLTEKKREKHRAGCFCVMSCGCGVHIQPSYVRGGPAFPITIEFLCMRLTLASYRHAVLLLLFFFGFAIVGMNVAQQDFVGAGAAGFVELWTMIVLCTFEDEQILVELESEVETLKEHEKTVNKRHNNVLGFSSRVDRLTNLWLYRTVPHLDVLKEVHDEAPGIPREQLVDYFSRSGYYIAEIDKALGPLYIWYGETALSMEKLQSVAAQLTNSAWVVHTEETRRNTPLPTIVPHRSQYKRKSTLEVKALNSGWKGTDSAQRCHECDATFGMLSAPINCRRCGEVFCNNCTRYEPVPELGFAEKQHVCTSCQGKTGWVDKDKCLNCSGCKVAFGWINRRHHCRRCGNVFCGTCTDHEAFVPKLGYITTPVRVCGACVKLLDQEIIDDEIEQENEARVPEMAREVNCMSFLTVKVRSADNLAKVGIVGMLPNPYVCLRVAQNELVRTRAVEETTSPRFNEEFFFPVSKDDSVLMLQVFGEANSGDDNFLGSIDINFRSYDPAIWHTVNQALDESKSGLLQMEIQFATDPAQLVPKPNPATQGRRRSQRNSLGAMVGWMSGEGSWT